jgi:predicted ABC-type ATPase
VTPVEPRIVVLAGVNGAGKSSVLGSFLDESVTFFNPDGEARLIRERTQGTDEQVNAEAWKRMRNRLEDAIENRESFAFESTLGGNTIPALLRKAAEAGIEVYIWFVGLASPELHMQRVRARVAAGGHDIPEEKIRERWNSSRMNIIELLPVITELVLFDNSEEGDPAKGKARAPRLLLHWRKGRVVAPPIQELDATPAWARPIAGAALKFQR